MVQARLGLCMIDKVLCGNAERTRNNNEFNHVYSPLAAFHPGYK